MNRRPQRDPGAIEFARNQRATANEFSSRVWQMLRDRRCRSQKFRREYSIPPYTTDFCCTALKLIIEVDGEHHQIDEGRRYDQRRDQYLAEREYQVVRIPGYEVLRDAAAVRRQIERAIDERMSTIPLIPGQSKKGRDLAKGGRFGSVALRTGWPTPGRNRVEQTG